MKRKQLNLIWLLIVNAHLGRDHLDPSESKYHRVLSEMKALKCLIVLIKINFNNLKFIFCFYYA